MDGVVRQDLKVTRDLAEWVAGTPAEGVSVRALQAASHAVLDWTGVTIAGAHEPLVEIMVADAVDEGGAGRVPLIGRPERLPAGVAALINGSASHALDYDDINKRLTGHPTVAILPAVLAVAAERDLTGAAVLDALTIGTEIACSLGEMMGHGHYTRGYHITATVGCVAAAAASARAMGLDTDQTARALAISASLASGVKANFGTMVKPLHAGRAAEGGLRAARWAARGFTANLAALEADQGFGRTLSPDFRPQPARPDPSAPWAIEGNVYKYHAACYFTHSAIEAATEIRSVHGLAPENIETVTVRAPAQHQLVCDITAPSTGLEVKFSIRHLVAMALSDIALDDPEIFSDETAARDDLRALRDRTAFKPVEHNSLMAAEVSVQTKDGRDLTAFADVSTPASDLDAQQVRLRAKFLALTGSSLGVDRAAELATLVLTIGEAADLSAYADLAAPAS